MGRPVDTFPYEEEPVEGNRGYRLQELAPSGRDDDADVEQVGAPSSAREADTFADADHDVSGFLMLAVVK